jgi:GNAT superfamily N-acetyltransferase
MPEVICTARSDTDYAAFGALVRDYVAWCRARYQEHAWAVDAAFSYQALDEELARLSTSYGGANGKTLLAKHNGSVVGCVAYRRLSPGICEMKRLFVPEQHQGRGLGRRLCQAIVDHAASDGFSLMRLDTGHLFHEAKRLYHSAGFAPCAPYNAYPERLMAFIVFMERPLTTS